MDSLKWEQNNAGLHIYVPASDGSTAKFTISTSQINQLHAGTPRIYNVFARFNNDNDESVYILDLEQLKPVIQKSSGLTLSLGKSKPKTTAYEGQSVGRYCLARGESYQDRFLTVSGWKSQRTYYDMYPSNAQPLSQPSKPTVQQPPKPATPPVSQPVTPPQPTTPPTPPTPPAPPKTKGKLTVCPYCGEVYPSSMPVCIYCNNQGKKQQDDDSVDISI